MPSLVGSEMCIRDRLNHVAIAVPDLAAACAQYETMLGANVGAPQDEPDHGVTVVFIELPNSNYHRVFIDRPLLLNP